MINQDFPNTEIEGNAVKRIRYQRGEYALLLQNRNLANRDISHLVEITASSWQVLDYMSNKEIGESWLFSFELPFDKKDLDMILRVHAPDEAAKYYKKQDQKSLILQFYTL